MGCTSDLGGNLGVLWWVQQAEDLDHVLNKGPTPPYIVVVERLNFTRKNILTFKKHTDRVSGILFIDRDHDDSRLLSKPFSPDDVCPNRYSGLYVNDSYYEECKQNLWQEESPVSGLLYDDIPFPIFLINDKDSVSDIENCFNEYNIKKTGNDREQAMYPLCGVQLDSFMAAAGNSELCVNSHSLIDDFLQTNGRRCSPVRSNNIFAYYRPAIANATYDNETRLFIPDVAPPQSITMLVAKLSSISMFTEISPGADSTLSAIITLLTVAEALGRVKNSTEVVESKRNIVFALLDNEPLDYSGSNKLIYDITRYRFPNFPRDLFRINSTSNETIQNLNLASIDLLINLDQMASYPKDDTIYLHSDPENKDEKFGRFLDIMKEMSYSENVKLKQAGEDSKIPLPPTSAQQFIKSSLSEKNSSRLMGIVLSNYEKHYSNMFYHSIYDDSHNIDQVTREKLADHISRVASFIAKSLYKITFNKGADNVSVDRDIVKQLLDCYLSEADCNLFTKVMFAGRKVSKETKIETFRDPTKRPGVNYIAASNLLAYFLGDKISVYNRTKCDIENDISLTYEYIYLNGKNEPINDTVSGECIRSQVLTVTDENPAIYLDKDQGKYIVDKSLPAWTISHNSIRNPVRIYLIPSPIYEWSVFILGLAITIASFIIVHQIRTTISKLKTLETVEQDIVA